MSEDKSDVLEAIEKAGRIAILTHDRPDGDAVGSTIGLGLMLESAGKTVILLNNDRVPNSLAFLPGTDKILWAGNCDGCPAVDLIIALDSAGRDRISQRVWNLVPSDVPLINIDHHVSNTRYGDINLVDAESPATGEIVHDLGIAAGWTVNREAAENLYAAISTDTGSLRYPNTTARTYRVAASLIDAGIDVGRVNQDLYENYPLRRIECIRDLLQGMKLYFKGRCVTVKLPWSLKTQLGLVSGDSEGVIDLIRSIDSAIVAVFFEEMDGGKIRVSSRSKKSGVNVGKICAEFGGGGHDLAAGARLDGSIDEAERLFLEAVERALDEGAPVT